MKIEDESNLKKLEELIEICKKGNKRDKTSNFQIMFFERKHDKEV